MKILPLFTPSFLCFCWCFLSAAELCAQSFAVRGGVPALHGTAELQQITEFYLYFDPIQGQDSLRLSWRRGDVEKPADWYLDLCDLGGCFTGIPSSGTMAWAFPNEAAYLKLLVRPEMTEGQARAQFRVFEAANPSAFVEVWFYISTLGSSDVSALDADAPQLILFPNPVSESYFYLKTNLSGAASFQILSATGQKMPQTQALITENLQQVDVSGLSSGTYFLQIFHNHTIHVLPFHVR